MLRFLIPLAGLGMAAAGADKLIGNRAYDRLYGHWGWTPQQMRLAGLSELLGGLLMANRGTRRLGGGVIAASSAVTLASELRHGDDGLAAARMGVLATALAALLATARRR